MARQRQFTADDQAERHADQQSAYRALQARLRAIGPLPPVEDQARRDQADGSLLFFPSNYFPGTFSRRQGALEDAQGGLLLLSTNDPIIRMYDAVRSSRLVVVIGGGRS